MALHIIKVFQSDTLKLDPFILLLLHPSSDSGADPGLILGCCQNFTKKIERRCNNDVI